MPTNIEFLRSSTFILNYNNTKVLFDPWLEDGEYYGSWSHFPPKIFHMKSLTILILCLIYSPRSF